MGGRILVVDDSPDFLTFMEEALGWEGHAVATARSVDELRDRLAEARPELVICELRIPGVEATPALDLLAEVPGIPVLVCTGAAHLVCKSDDWRRRPGWQLLLKPFYMDELRGRVEQFLAGGRQRSGDADAVEGDARAPVLVVDDDADTLALVQLTLADAGYAVVTATDGRQALERAGERRPALVLLDLTMPVLDGWQVHADLRQQDAAIPVVFMTAVSRARNEASRHQADGYLGKPFDQSTLLATVAQFLPAAC